MRKAFSAVTLLWLGSLAGAGFAFLTQIMLARALSPTSYGVFAAALATVTLLAPMSVFGVQGFWLKVFGAEGGRGVRWLPASFRFLTVSCGLTSLIYLLWTAWGPHENSTSLLLYLLFPMLFGYLYSELVNSKYLLEDRFRALAMWQLFPHVARFVLVAVLILFGNAQSSISAIAIVYSVVAALVLIVGYKQLRGMRLGQFNIKGHGVKHDARLNFSNNDAAINAMSVARQTWPFGLSTIFHLIYFQSDIVILKYISGGEVAGIYNVAFTVMAAVYLLPSVIYQKFLLPRFHRWSNYDREKFYQVYRKGNIAMAVLGIAAMLIILITAFWAIPSLFGEEYMGAVSIIYILSICAPVMFVASSVGAVLVTQENMIRKTKYMGGVAVLNIILNFALIPYYGAIGAAVSTVMSNIVLLIIYYVSAERLVFRMRNAEQ